MIDAAEREKVARELAKWLLVRVSHLGILTLESPQCVAEISERMALCANEALEKAAQVAGQYHKQLSLNGATAEIWSVASDIRDDIRALKAEG